MRWLRVVVVYTAAQIAVSLSPARPVARRRTALSAEPPATAPAASAVAPPELPPFVLRAPSEEADDDELTNENIGCLVWERCSDDEVNRLVWKCLGYRRAEGAPDDAPWENDAVFPKWRARFPQPPDLVGVTRVYSPDVDEPVLRANQALHRSIPMAHKDGIRENLRAEPVRFLGFKLEGLTPNKTRRAQCANWLLYYRSALWRRSLEELIAARDRDVEAENRAAIERGESLRVVRGPGEGSGAPK